MHASDKGGVGAVGLPEDAFVYLTVVFVGGRAFFGASSEPFVALDACLRSFLTMYLVSGIFVVVLRSNVGVEHATFVRLYPAILYGAPSSFFSLSWKASFQKYSWDGMVPISVNVEVIWFLYGQSLTMGWNNAATFAQRKSMVVGLHIRSYGLMVWYKCFDGSNRWTRTSWMDSDGMERRLDTAGIYVFAQ